MVPVLPPDNNALSCAFVPVNVTVSVLLPEVKLLPDETSTPESPASINTRPAPTLNVALRFAPLSSVSAILKPLPCIIRLPCSLTLSTEPGAVTTGASLTALTVISRVTGALRESPSLTTHSMVRVPVDGLLFWLLKTIERRAV